MCWFRMAVTGRTKSHLYFPCQAAMLEPRGRVETPSAARPPSTRPYESASRPGLIVPLTCSNRRPGRWLTAKVTAKW